MDVGEGAAFLLLFALTLGLFGLARGLEAALAASALEPFNQPLWTIRIPQAKVHVIPQVLVGRRLGWGQGQSHQSTTSRWRFAASR